MAEHGHTNTPVQLMQSICNQVQAAQEGYPMQQERGYAGPPEAYGSRSMILPDLPVSRVPIRMDEAPFANLPLFRGVVSCMHAVRAYVYAVYCMYVLRSIQAYSR